MKTDPSAPRDVAAGISPDVPLAGGRKRAPVRRRVALGLIVVLVLAILIGVRHAIVGALATRWASLATGDHVTIGEFHIGLRRAVLVDLNVTSANGDPLFRARRITLGYALAELLPGSHHRYGLRSATVDSPVLAIVRRADGSYNLRSAGGSAGTSAVASPAWNCVVRVRNGTLALIDRAPATPDLAEQRIVGLSLRGAIDAGGKTAIVGGGALIAAGRAAAAGRRWPFTVHVRLDTTRGSAIGRLRAARLPARGLLSFFVHGNAVRIDDGYLDHVALTMYGLGPTMAMPALRVGGTADLSAGELHIAALATPVRDMRGRLTLVDDGVWLRRLDARVAGLPVVARGGIYNRNRPTLRLGLAADGDLSELRSLFAFSHKQPIRGGVHVETLLEAPTAELLIRSALRVGHGSYGTVPFSAVSGRVDYHNGSVVLDGLRGEYGAAAVGVGARFVLGRPALTSAIVATARAPGRAIPFGENVAPDAQIDAVALIRGGVAGYRANGALGVAGPSFAGSGTFAIDERGSGEFGPFTLARGDGSRLDGALRLERPTSESAGWLTATNYRVAVPVRAARFPGLHVPSFPPVAGILTGAVTGSGHPDGFALAGNLSGDDLTVGTVHVGHGRTALGGTLADVRLGAVRLDGPLGAFTGSGAASHGTFALRGAYDGSLEKLVPLTGKQDAFGAVRGDVLATLDDSGVVVQSRAAVLHGATIRGVALDRAAGTIAVRDKIFEIIAATGDVLGGHAVAAQAGQTIAISAPDIPSAALRGTGVPLAAGNVSAYGIADVRRPAVRFDGDVAVSGGRSNGFAVGGEARVALDGGRAAISDATGSLGSTFGSLAGAVTGIGERALHYDLDARVPLGDLDVVRHDLKLPLRALAGSFAAQLHVHGTGIRPFAEGRVEAPEGSYHGLAFRTARANVALDHDSVAASDGQVTIGSTTALVDASAALGGAFSFSARAATIALADFNDFFDTDATLDGRGSMAISLRTAGGLATSGAFALDGLRYRDYRIGRASADWRMRGAAIEGQARARSWAGRLDAQARIVPGPSGANLADAVRAAGYDVRATLGGIDVATWLPATGRSAPISGTVDAALSVHGRVPDLRTTADLTLRNGRVRGVAIPSAHLAASSQGSRIVVAASDADLGFGRLTATGQVGLAHDDPLRFDLRLSTPDIGIAAHELAPASRRFDIAGALDADIRVGGTRSAPSIEGGFDLTAARYGGFAVPRAIGSLAVSGRGIELRDADVELTRGQAFVAGSLPLLLQPLRLGPARSPLSFDVTARGVDLAQFAPLLPAGTQLAGTVDGRFGVEGSVERPRLFGSLAVSGGSYVSPLERAPIDHVDAQLEFAGSSVALQTFHADVGGGTLDASGRVTLPFGEETQAAYRAEVVAKAAKLNFPAYGRGTLDGDLVLSSGQGRPLIGGDIALRDAVVPVSAVYGNGSVGAANATALPVDPAFAIHAAAGDNVRVRSSIVDIGVTGAVDVSGTLGHPLLGGGFTATDGTISSYNHVFKIVNAAVAFNPADGAVPTIDARAIARVTNPDPDPNRNVGGSATIIVTVSGSADSNNLQVTYSSEPAYSQEQIIGLLLDVPALLGALNFDLNGGPSAPVLRGVPGETNVLLPPGVTPEEVSSISLNEEVFSLLNGQLTQRALTPLERLFEKNLGLSDVEFTVDYGGGLGYSLRRQIGRRDFYAFLSETVTYPERLNVGFELVPKPFESVNFGYYAQNGVTSLITNQTPGQEIFSSTGRRESVQPLGNRSGFSLNFNRRF
jgi:hypothetical protein